MLRLSLPEKSTIAPVYCSVLCRVLQCVAVCCSVLQCVAVCCSVLHSCHTCDALQLLYIRTFLGSELQRSSRTTLQHTLQHTATCLCNTLQHIATHCNTLQHTATHYNTLQHTATRCNTLQHTATRNVRPRKWQALRNSQVQRVRNVTAGLFDWADLPPPPYRYDDVRCRQVCHDLYVT